MSANKPGEVKKVRTYIGALRQIVAKEFNVSNLKNGLLFSWTESFRVLLEPHQHSLAQQDFTEAFMIEVGIPIRHVTRYSHGGVWRLRLVKV